MLMISGFQAHHIRIMLMIFENVSTKWKEPGIESFGYGLFAFYRLTTKTIEKT